MMWANFFEAGGWGMYPTSLFGFLLVAAGVLFLLRPERRFVPLVLGLGVVTLGSGLLSCSVGIVNTLHYLQHIEPARKLEVATIGFAESMHNVVLALILIVLSALIACIGAWRAARAAAPGSAAAS